MTLRYPSDAELIFLRELGKNKVRFMVVGMAGAILQGANLGTEDLDLWLSSFVDDGIDTAARAAGGMFAWRASPPMITGANLQNLDILRSCKGLGDFESEYSHSLEADIFGVPVRVLPLERIIASKKACNREKDRATMPALKAALLANQAVGKTVK